MKKALQGFWRGGLLGGLLGLLGGMVFTFWIPFLEILQFGLYFGIVIGGLIGVPLMWLEKQQVWKRIAFSVVTAVLLFKMVVIYFRDVLPQLTFGGIRWYSEYVNYRCPIQSIYLIAAILFGYYFPNFKPRWPKFLRRKVQDTEEATQ